MTRAQDFKVSIYCHLQPIHFRPLRSSSSQDWIGSTSKIQHNGMISILLLVWFSKSSYSISYAWEVGPVILLAPSPPPFSSFIITQVKGVCSTHCTKLMFNICAIIFHAQIASWAALWYSMLHTCLFLVILFILFAS